MKILIGYDGSTSAEAIRQDLRRAGLPDDVNALVLAASDVFLPSKPSASVSPSIKPIVEKLRRRAEQALRTAQSLADGSKREFHAMFPGWTIESEASSEVPSWALIKKAESWKPDLIAVGAHGHARLGRFTGSVSQMVTVHAPCSVRVCRPSPSSKSKNLRVIIGLDGSSDSGAAVAAVASRSWPKNTEIFLVSTINPRRSALHAYLTPPLLKWFLDKADSERTVLGRMQESYANVLRRKGCVVTCVIKEGDPKDVLVQQANAWKADGIFVGARGLSQTKRFLLGGVSSSVAAGAPCSVEIIRR